MATLHDFAILDDARPLTDKHPRPRPFPPVRAAMSVRLPSICISFFPAIKEACTNETLTRSCHPALNQGREIMPRRQSGTPRPRRDATVRGGTDRVEVEGVELLDDRVLLIQLGRGRRKASSDCHACQQESAGKHRCFSVEWQGKVRPRVIRNLCRGRQRQGAADPHVRSLGENRVIENAVKFPLLFLA